MGNTPGGSIPVNGLERFRLKVGAPEERKEYAGAWANWLCVAIGAALMTAHILIGELRWALPLIPLTMFSVWTEFRWHELRDDVIGATTVALALAAFMEGGVSQMIYTSATAAAALVWFYYWNQKGHSGDGDVLFAPVLIAIPTLALSHPTASNWAGEWVFNRAGVAAGGAVVALLSMLLARAMSRGKPSTLAFPGIVVLTALLFPRINLWATVGYW